MPTYDYLCQDCGAFDSYQPMSASGLPQPCPGCGMAAPRSILTAPRMAMMSSVQRNAAATNERSRHAPMTNGQYQAKHKAGCACCAPAPRKLQADAPAAAKGFPGKRPWMISH